MCHDRRNNSQVTGLLSKRLRRWPAGPAGSSLPALGIRRRLLDRRSHDVPVPSSLVIRGKSGHLHRPLGSRVHNIHFGNHTRRVTAETQAALGRPAAVTLRVYRESHRAPRPRRQRHRCLRGTAGVCSSTSTVRWARWRLSITHNRPLSRANCSGASAMPTTQPAQSNGQKGDAVAVDAQ